MERFEEYLQLLQGDTKGDLKLPLGGFNPMAKEHILDKLDDLRKLDAEKIVAETLNEINREYGDPSRVFQTAINLADDWKGGWTNRFATDFDSKFKIMPL